MLRVFFIITYILLIFYNAIYQYIPGMGYLDEFISIVLLVLALIKVMQNKGKIKPKKAEVKIVLCLLGIFMLGIISTLYYQIVTDKIIIIKDIILTFKFFISYLCGSYILEQYKNKLLCSQLVRLAKIILSIIFLFGIISLFVNIGMGDSVRFGLRSYQFIYSHYTYLVFNTVILMCTILCEDKNNWKYHLMGIVVLILTLRTKAIMFAVLFVSMQLFVLNKKKNLNLEKFFNVRNILLITIPLFMVAWPKIKQYIAWGVTYNLRNGLYIKGLQVAKDYFPLGSGFGTFATNLSYKSGSSLYRGYGLLSYQGIADDGYAVISDVYWPSIYAQFGLLGFLLFIIALYYLLKLIIKGKKVLDVNVILSSVCVVAYLVISSIAEASFSNEIGVFASVFILIFSGFKIKNVDS